MQESFLKALGAIHTLRGGDARSWLLSIVRNTAINFLNRQKPALQAEGSEAIEQRADSAPDAEHTLIAQSRSDRVRSAIDRLQPEFREALVLREIEGLAYKEIGFVLKVPIGTVMSRLSRARNLLAQELLTEGAGL